MPGRRLSGPRRGSGGLGPAAARPPRVRRGAHCARWAPRPSAGADRRSARPHARVPPARDPSELPARLPCRANAGRAPELDARHRPRRPTATLASCRARHGAVVLQRAAACPVGASRDHAAGLFRPRALERAARERGAVPRRCASPAATGGCARGQLGPHGRQGRDLAVLRPVRRAEPRHGGGPAPLPRDRVRAHPRHRLAADGSPPSSSAARSLRGAPGAVRARPGPPPRARRR